MSVSNFVILVSMTAGIYLALKLALTHISYYVQRLLEKSRAFALVMGAAIWGALWMIFVAFELMVRMRLGLVPERYAVVAYFQFGGLAILIIHVLLFPYLDRYIGLDDAEP